MNCRALLPLAGLAIALGACSSGGGRDTGGADAAPAASPMATAPAAAPTMPTTTGPLPVDATPTTARGAVEAFLVAEVHGDAPASYALLSAPQQRAYSANEWLHAQADLPRYLGFTVRDGAAAGRRQRHRGHGRRRPAVAPRRDRGPRARPGRDHADGRPRGVGVARRPVPHPFHAGPAARRRRARRRRHLGQRPPGLPVAERVLQPRRGTGPGRRALRHRRAPCGPIPPNP